MARIFDDVNEPFWRSAKTIDLGPIPLEPFAAFIAERFRTTKRNVNAEVLDEALALTGGHPYATQELCYFLWERTPAAGVATRERLQEALEGVLRSEHAHFSLLWESASASQKLVLGALAREPGRPFTAAYRSRHELPPATNVQKALRALTQREIAAGEDGSYQIAEPFLAEWIRPRVASA